MTIDFIDPRDLVETVHTDYNEDPTLSEVIVDDALRLELRTQFRITRVTFRGLL